MEVFSIPSEKVKNFLETNPNSVVLDVRTEEEWNGVGKPDAESLNSKTFFISLLLGLDRKKKWKFYSRLSSEKNF